MPLIELQKASVFLGAAPILRDLNWTLERGGHFAVLGGNGVGKSTFLRLIAGRIWPRPHDSRVYDFGTGKTWSPLRARPKIALLSPEIQERFTRQARDGIDGERGWQLDARTAVCAGLFDAELLHQTPSDAQSAQVEIWLARLEIADLAHRELRTLSQGQLRRVLLARALISRPEVLLLDEACSGLDAASRDAMLQNIEFLAASGSVTLGMTTHRTEEIVPAIQAVYHLENGRFRGENAADAAAKSGAIAHLQSFAGREIENQKRQASDAGAISVNELSASDFELIRLEKASVWLDGAPILRGLNWTWNRGEHFRIEGGNGSGKTTLLRLLRGEVFPARGGKIARFGEEKLRSRAEIGRRIALLSPALQALYADEIAVETAVASGFFDSFGVSGELSAMQRERVAKTLETCDLTELKECSFARLSYGQRRRVLLARALVGNPQILLLDEALDGLDARARAQFYGILAAVAARGTHLAVVSHHASDYPPFLTHRLQLRGGEIAQISEN